jgi:hypothetical protein
LEVNAEQPPNLCKSSIVLKKENTLFKRISECQASGKQLLSARFHSQSL